MDPNESPEELVLRVHFYGIRSSGGLCMAAVKQLIQMARREDLRNVAQVLESAYVDDCNSSVGDIDDLDEIKQMMPGFMAGHGMAIKALAWTGEEAPKELSDQSDLSYCLFYFIAHAFSSVRQIKPKELKRGPVLALKYIFLPQ